jgi:hypothetical protein
VQGGAQSATRSEVEREQRQVAAVTIGELDFAVDQYIVIGSPLGLFLALRKVRYSPLHLWSSKTVHWSRC